MWSLTKSMGTLKKHKNSNQGGEKKSVAKTENDGKPWSPVAWGRQKGREGWWIFTSERGRSPTPVIGRGAPEALPLPRDWQMAIWPQKFCPSSETDTQPYVYLWGRTGLLGSLSQSEVCVCVGWGCCTPPWKWLPALCLDHKTRGTATPNLVGPYTLYSPFETTPYQPHNCSIDSHHLKCAQ